MSKQITLKPIDINKKHLLENLVSLYLHDLSQYADDLVISDKGRFEYQGLHLYFEKQDLIPLLIYKQDKIIGFILLNMGHYVDENIDFSVHEFFILKGYRRKGLASLAINELFKNYQGIYKIGQLAENKPAIQFWNKLYKINNIEYRQYTELVEGIECVTQVFNV